GGVGGVLRRPLHERVWEIERERRQRLQVLAAELDEEDGATFAPALGRLSERLARDARPPGLTGGVGKGRVCVRGGEAMEGRAGRLGARLEWEAERAKERRQARIMEYEE
ncbi:unnamed protein product, partial [Choristocarpus tenellus]